MVKFSFVLVCCTVLLLDICAWEYGEEDEWPGQCLTGERQSPVNLRRKKSTCITQERFNYDNYNLIMNLGVLTQTLAILRKNVNVKPVLSGGDLEGKYLMDHIHWHWRSEHMIESKRFPLEIHLVHHSEKYPDVPSAVNDPTGLAVLGAIYAYGDKPNNFLQKIIDLAKQNKLQEDIEVTLNDVLPRRRFGNYYRYLGSLTAPLCFEAVVWTVFENYLSTTRQQIAEFRRYVIPAFNLTSTTNRRIQPLKGRRTFYIGA